MLETSSVVILVVVIILFILFIYTAYQVYMKDNPYEVVLLDEIRIKRNFSKAGIDKCKLRRKDNFYTEFGYFQDRIILDENNYLLDGYSTYMLAKSYGFKEIEIIRDKKEGKV